MKRLVVSLLVATSLSVSLVTAVGRPSRQKKNSQIQKANELLQEGDAFRSHGQLSSALWAYRRAAKAGSVNGALAAGDLLLKQGQAASGLAQILKLSEGLEDLFLAATNDNAQACADLSHALENGIGVKTNLVSAYAWLELAAKRDLSFRPALDRLVVQLPPSGVLQAQVLAAKYARGHWPTDLIHPVDQGDPSLILQGISGNGHRSLVIINDTSFGVGDSAIVRSANSHGAKELAITCLRIGRDYALVSIAGESHWKLLSTAMR